MRLRVSLPITQSSVGAADRRRGRGCGGRRAPMQPASSVDLQPAATRRDARSGRRRRAARAVAVRTAARQGRQHGVDDDVDRTLAVSRRRSPRPRRGRAIAPPRRWSRSTRPASISASSFAALTGGGPKATRSISPRQPAKRRPLSAPRPRAAEPRDHRGVEVRQVCPSAQWVSGGAQTGADRQRAFQLSGGIGGSAAGRPRTASRARPRLGHGLAARPRRVQLPHLRPPKIARIGEASSEPAGREDSRGPTGDLAPARGPRPPARTRAWRASDARSGRTGKITPTSLAAGA